MGLPEHVVGRHAVLADVARQPQSTATLDVLFRTALDLGTRFYRTDEKK